MKLSAVRIFVDDLAAARTFYTDTLNLKPAWEHPGIAVGFDVGVMLIIEPVAADADAEDRAMVSRFTGVSFEVDDINAAHAALSAKNVKFTAPPAKQDWGGSLAHFEDPSGNVLTLVQQ